MKRQGAVGNKLKDSRSDMSEVRHKYMDSRGEMIVPSGLKTGVLIVLWKGKIERSGDPMQWYKT